MTVHYGSENSVNVINVKTRFGAKGDGVTDDTAAIQAAIDASSTAGGGTVFFPDGTYLCGQLTIGNNVRLQGSPLTQILASSASVMVIVSGNNIEITSIDFNGDDTATGGIHLAVDSVRCSLTRNIIRNITASGQTVDGIFFQDGCDNLTIRENYIHDIYTGDGQPSRAIRGADTVDPPVNVRIIGNEIDNIYPVNDADGIVIQNWSGNCNILISNNTLSRCAKRGVKIQSPGVLVTSNVITMSNVGGGADPYCGIWLGASNTSACSNLISGPCTFAAIGLGNTSGTVNTVASSNMINFGSHANASCDGLKTDSGAVTGLVIVANSIAGTHRYGVNLAHACEGSVINGNVSVGASASPYMLAGAPTSTAIVGNAAIDYGHYLAHDNNTGTAIKTTIAGNASDAGGFGIVSATLLVDSQAFANGTSSTTFANTVFIAPYSLTVNSATPSVYGQRRAKTVNSSGTTITAINDGVAGQELDLIITDANTTIQHNSTIKLNGGVNFVPGASGGALRLINDDGVWKETGRAAF